MTGFRWGDHRGAVPVEFALGFPVLMLALFGVVEFGAVYNAQLMVNGAARDAAVEMSVEGDPRDARSAALSASSDLVPQLTAGDIAFSSPRCAAGIDVTVTISYEKPFLTGMFGATVDLTGIATRPCVSETAADSR